jgi:STE24 endopeptidase
METVIVSLFLAFFLLRFLVEFGLNELNLRHVRARSLDSQPPEFIRGKMSTAEYQKSVQYTLANGGFQRWAELYGSATTLAVLLSGLLPWLDRLTGGAAGQFGLGVFGHGILFCLGLSLVLLLLGLPTELCSTFGIEAKFGFNKTTAALFIADKIKGLMLGVLIGVPFLWVLFWLMQAMGSYWWLWAFGFIALFQLVMIVIFPTFIAPWFNKFEPLKEGEFRDRIMKLADEIGFKTSGIYSMDGSKRSAHSNAYFTGIGKAKRIVLFDTLIEQMTVDQGLAVLAHEMGHYKMKHIRRMLVVQTVFLFVALYVLSLLIDFTPFTAPLAWRHRITQPW